MDFLIGIEPREYQTEIFKKCVEKNCLVVLSTGMGKTLIALMVAIERMKRFPGQKVVFLAPTRPLAEQHLKYFEKHLPELFADMQIFTGKIHAPERKKIWKTADIIFSTPQCIANDIEKSLYNLEEVCLLIEDEAHRCMKNYDYNIVAKRYMEQSSEPRILGLTASPGSEKSRIKEICRNLFIEEVELRGRESEDVKPYMQIVDFKKEMVDFPKEFEEIRVSLSGLFNSYVNELKERKVLFAMPSKSVLIGLQKKIMASISNPKVIRDLDVAILHEKIIPSKIQSNLKYLRGMPEYRKRLFKEVSRGQHSAIWMCAAPNLKQLKAVSDAALVMPAKSTYFYPKLLSGLLIRPFNEV